MWHWVLHCTPVCYVVSFPIIKVVEETINVS
jgi:hypothetical protein